MIQFVEAGPKAIGGPWTGIMILTYMFALMGIQSWLRHSQCDFLKPKSKALYSKFGLQLLVLVLFFVFLYSSTRGGSHFLGANLDLLTNNPEVVNNVMGPNLGGKDLMETASKQRAGTSTH